MPEIKTRASSLPLALRCPASTVQAEIRIEGDRGAADLGTAAHDVVLRWVGNQDGANVNDVAARKRVDPDELGILVAMGFQAWNKVEQWFPDPQVEVEMAVESAAGLRLTGHTDMKSVVDREVRIGDLKFGRVDSDYTQQLAGYCCQALQMHPECDTAFAMVIWVREQRTESARYTRQQMDRWFEEVETTLSQVDLFSPGSHCGYCRRKYECPAFELMLKRNLELLANGERPDRPVAVGDLYAAAKLVNKQAEEALELVRAEVAAAGGTMNIGYGKQLQLMDQEQEKISYTAGHRLITQAVPGADLDEIFTVGKGAFTKAVGDTAPNRKKKVYIDAAMQDLRAAGAVTKKVVTQLEQRRNEHGTAELSGVDRILGYEQNPE